MTYFCQIGLYCSCWEIMQKAINDEFFYNNSLGIDFQILWTEMLLIFEEASVAQCLCHSTFKPEVAGSIPGFSIWDYNLRSSFHMTLAVGGMLNPKSTTTTTTDIWTVSCDTYSLKGKLSSDHVSLRMGNQQFAYAKTKTQISCALTQLCSKCTRIVQSLFFVNPKVQVSGLLLWLYRLVCVELNCWFSQGAAHVPSIIFCGCTEPATKDLSVNSEIGLGQWMKPQNWHARLNLIIFSWFISVMRCEKTDLWGFRPSPTQTSLYSHEAWNFIFGKKMRHTIYGAKKGADQLCTDCTADQRLWFCICKMFVFSWCSSFYIANTLKIHQSPKTLKNTSWDAKHSKWSLPWQNPAVQ